MTTNYYTFKFGDRERQLPEVCGWGQEGEIKNEIILSDFKYALRKRMNHCSNNVLTNQSEVIYNDGGYVIFKDGSRFSRPAYVAMEEAIKKISNALVARNWEFIVDGKKVYKEAKAMRIKTLADVQLDLTPMKSDEEREIEQLKAKLSQLQREIEEREAAFEKKNKLSKTGNEILEMFNLTVDDLKEIVSIL